MKGLYLNVREAPRKIRHAGELIGTNDTWKIASESLQGLDLHISYSSNDWPNGPTFFDPEGRYFAAGSGWFFYRGTIGNLQEFADAFVDAHRRGAAHAVARQIEAGAFLILLVIGDKRFVITDPFGLHPHYCVHNSDPPQIAPAPQFFDSLAENPRLAAILTKQNHLFGNYTSYGGIQRLQPGAILEGGKTTQYFDYRPTRFSAEDLHTELSRFIAQFVRRKRLLPISGGLDSRFLLGCGDFDLGYTFGPGDTGDRPVARRFSRLFKDYTEFSFLDLAYPNKYRVAGNLVFDGICSRPFVELLSAYSYLSEAFGDDYVFFDGYGGDVLQRGLYLTSGGIAGSLAKLLPVLTTRRFDPLRLLRRRYSGLTDDEFELLATEYEEQTRSWDLDIARKYVLFELLHGRGARHILNGGTTMSNQFFTAVQPYFAPEVFRILFALDPLESVTYTNIRRIWSVAPKQLTGVATYSGFKPLWHPVISRTAMLVVKGLGRLKLYKRSISYEKELRHVVWEPESERKTETAASNFCVGWTDVEGNDLDVDPSPLPSSVTKVRGASGGCDELDHSRPRA